MSAAAPLSVDMNKLNAFIGQFVSDLARAVRGIVVDDEHIHVVRGERAEHRFEVLALVVGR